MDLRRLPTAAAYRVEAEPRVLLGLAQYTHTPLRELIPPISTERDGRRRRKGERKTVRHSDDSKLRAGTDGRMSSRAGVKYLLGMY